ncbi:MAG: DUF2911 domain-containing protein [Gemmatimonadetes bacterium]|nr:DUF2911 domain-containing protein [Gemmatimonadota bacterium]
MTIDSSQLISGEIMNSRHGSQGVSCTLQALIVLGFLAFPAPGVSGQEATDEAASFPCEPAPSSGADGLGAPIDTATVTIGGEALQVCYRAPSARGRPVFGHSLTYTDTRWVVQYDTLWNTGMVIHTAAAVEVAGIRVDPGSYAIYAIPSSTDWMIALSPDTDGFLSGEPYSEDAHAREAGRAMVRAGGTAGYVERLTVHGEPAGSSTGSLVLEWERTQVRIPIRLAETRATLTCELRGAPERLAQRGSPPDSVMVRLGGREAKLCYGRPSVRDRKIFGGLVPYDDLWRTGANEATVIHLPFPAEIAGIAVDPGDYAILTIPSRGDWVVVVNASTNQWGRVTPTVGGGRSQYSEGVRAQEVGRAMVRSGTTDGHVEMFTIRAEEAGADAAILVLEWENTWVRIPIRAR